ncbi:MAG: UDP-N-acetylmuramoyl-tripeptide--D-alanyl-D-alanine ligase [Christensenellales bacterium]|jgi:UDP-N-acetylmuramoyl-tripeptide--D-alanyl-D-alanine ligase
MWYLLLIPFVAMQLIAGRHYLHMLQLESYQLNMYFKWLSKNAWYKAPVLCLIPFAAAIYAALIETLPELFFGIIAVLIIIIMGMIFAVADRVAQKKKPLVYTARVKRQIVMHIIILLVIGFAVIRLLPLKASVLLLIGMMLLPALFTALAAVAALPFEKAVQRQFFNEARGKLADMDVIKIGVTGSYGKTSVKFILGTILSEKYETLVTPSSYNTPMGVTRVIRETLSPKHQVFVAEMGARYKGDIRELCDLVKPDYGVITAIGPQHLETFGSIENVAATKLELIDSLGEKGTAFLPDDGGICADAYFAIEGKKKVLFGLSERCDVRAEEIKTGPEGSSFDIVCRPGRINVTAVLLGRHNVLNIVAGAAVALELGLTLEQIAAGISKIEPIEHRLQLIKGPITVIDDAFNSNPAGSRAALDVLASFEGRKIIVTPGLVEQGSAEEEANRAFGRNIAATADLAILVGKSFSQHIKDGLLEEGFDEKNIIMADSLAKVSEMMPGITKPGDVVLFENDLPENYK